MIGIIDYGAGNIQGLANAFKKISAPVKIVKTKEKLLNQKALVLPGVGSFGSTIKALKNAEMYDSLKYFVQNGGYILGICVGMQILFTESEENHGVKGLDFINAKVLKLQNKKYKVPNLGWNTVKIPEYTKLFKDIPNCSYFYFMHSFYVPILEDYQISTTNYDVEFSSSIEYNNIFATQFHPEKSGKLGLMLLSNFYDIVR